MGDIHVICWQFLSFSVLSYLSIKAYKKIETSTGTKLFEGIYLNISAITTGLLQESVIDRGAGGGPWPPQ